MVRIATFNLNNLFDRFNFHAAVGESPKEPATYRWNLDKDRKLILSDDSDPETTATTEKIIEGTGSVRIEMSMFGLVKPKPEEDTNALLERVDRLNADVLAVQEVENIRALRDFNNLLDAPYPYLVLLEGNDPREIDVGLLSRLPIGSATSHRWYPDPEDPNKSLFSRDLLAVEILDQDGKNELLTVWVCHLKSKFVDPKITDPEKKKEEQEEDDAKRKREAKAIHAHMEAYHTEDDLFLVCGDFNDHPDSDPLTPLTDSSLDLSDVLAANPEVDFERPEGEGPRISNPEDQPADENWTHRFQVSNAPDVYERFDQILVSPELKKKQISARIQRRTHWGKHKSGTDHDAVYADFDFD